MIIQSSTVSLSSVEWYGLNLELPVYFELEGWYINQYDIVIYA